MKYSLLPLVTCSILVSACVSMRDPNPVAPSALVSNTLAAYKLSFPEKNLSYVSRSKLNYGKNGEANITTQLESTARPGVWKLKTVKVSNNPSEERVEDLTFLGIIPLSSSSFYLSSTWISILRIEYARTDYLVLRGDWENMPIGKKIGFTAGIYNRPDGMPSYQEIIAEECEVAESLPARQLHPKLKGNYKVLRCAHKKTVKFPWKSEIREYDFEFVRYFLEQYGFAVLANQSEFLGVNDAP
jgi:hypothetical protein